MVEFSFDRDEFRPDPSDRRREADRREERERFMDEQRREQAFLDDQRREMERDAQEEALRRVVNDPDIVVDPTLLEVINNPLMEMGKDMVVRTRRLGQNRPMTGRQVIRRSGQFANLALGVDLPKEKRKRKKTKTDKTMKAALTQANKELRKKNGQLRKGVTQADIMRRAHRIRRKMS
jgi:hypothetical protein